MKRIILLVLLLLPLSFIHAQKQKAPVKKPVVAKPSAPLKNLTDSASYCVGMSVANFYKEQGLSNLNGALVSKAINDVLNGKPTLWDATKANDIMNKYLREAQTLKAKPTVDSGQHFLAKNKMRPGVKTTASGLQYEVITEGTGPKPTAQDSVTCNYTGTFINGVEFDASRGNPITFYLGRVIPGWTEGLQLMSVGSKYKFYVPYNLGYGVFDFQSIPGGSALVFEVELLGVIKH